MPVTSCRICETTTLDQSFGSSFIPERMISHVTFDPAARQKRFEVMKDNIVETMNVHVSISPKKSDSFISIANPVITCPLDESHRILFTELQSHLERCLIGDLIVMTCPWNSQHIIDEASYEYHTTHCQDMTIKDEPQEQSPGDKKESS